MYWFLRWFDSRRKRTRKRRGAFGIAMSLPVTEVAEEIVEAAYREVRRSKCGYAGTQHLLLALSKETECVAGKVLKRLGIDSRSVRSEVTKLDDVPKDASTGSLPGPIRTPVLKESLKLAVEEATSLGEKSVQSEHILLALVRNHDSIAAEVLKNLGVTLDRVREEIHQMRDGRESAGGNPHE